jgi:hypothetical protein
MGKGCRILFTYDTFIKIQLKTWKQQRHNLLQGPKKEIIEQLLLEMGEAKGFPPPLRDISKSYKEYCCRRLESSFSNSALRHFPVYA